MSRELERLTEKFGDNDYGAYQQVSNTKRPFLINNVTRKLGRLENVEGELGFELLEAFDLVGKTIYVVMYDYVDKIYSVSEHFVEHISIQKGMKNLYVWIETTCKELYCNEGKEYGYEFSANNDIWFYTREEAVDKLSELLGVKE